MHPSIFAMAREEKLQTNIRLTPTARKAMVQLSDIMGIAQGDVVELLLRAEAARLGLPGHRGYLRQGQTWPALEEIKKDQKDT